mgnify:CR=1 FL=1
MLNFSSHSKLVLLTLFTLIVCSFLKAQPDNVSPTFSYLALGDSYTIGESIQPEDRWPNQLKNSLDTAGFKINELKIIAETGWRTNEMLRAAKNQLSDTTFDLVSLLIGVNNEYQGKSPKSFESEFEKCLKYAISKSKHGSKGVFVLSIPDYGYTPFGEKKQKTISKRIDAYNEICKRISEEYGVAFISITDISRKVKENEDLVAHDKLHPSAKQYALWVKRAVDDVAQMISSF